MNNPTSHLLLLLALFTSQNLTPFVHPFNFHHRAIQPPNHNSIRKNQQQHTTTPTNLNKNKFTSTTTTTTTTTTTSLHSSRAVGGMSIGIGQPLVDLSIYNIPLSQILIEWTAELIPRSSYKGVIKEEGAYLNVKSKELYFVDEVRVEVERDDINTGLGLELTEIAGGREDGLGITVVSGFVNDGGDGGGCCVDVGVMKGDCLSMVEVRRRGEQQQQQQQGKKQAPLSEIVRSNLVRTECLGYDATVQALQSVLLSPPPNNEQQQQQQQPKGDTIILTLKRIRRRPKIKVNLQFPPSSSSSTQSTSIELFAGENLRQGMLTRGIKLNDALSRRFDSGGMGNCGASGQCATCVVAITKGWELLNEAKDQEKQMLKKNPRWRMSCKSIVGYGMKEGEMTVRVTPRQW